MSALDDLLDHIFDGRKPALYPEFKAWVRGSRRFRAFAVSYAAKIRTKLKRAGDGDGLSDVRAELETAAILLRDERFTLAYETYAASKQRGPDFTVTFKTHTPFNVEVRRLRNLELDAGDTDARTNKLIAVLCDKVGQMPPAIVNLLWLTTDHEISEADLNRASATLRQLAERKTEEFFMRRGFDSAGGFLRQYRHLSGIVVCQPGGSVVWLNPLARHRAPAEIVTAVQRAAAT